MSRCFSCFKECDDSLNVCPFCGEKISKEPIEPVHLIPGTVLADRYIIGLAVGSGGFGIIYQAWDAKLETIVAVKEFFAGKLVTRAAGTKDVIANKKSIHEFEYRKARFLAEARNMAKFGAHRNIPNVFEFFEENNTAYIVMELLHGIALNDYLHTNNGIIDSDFAIMIANEVGKALISLHEKGIIHRDVAPDNIYISSDKELRIKLLDFGAAKLSDGTEDISDIILKIGYSPVEQYNNAMSIGPWTDVYALGATLYLMLTGIKPEESTDRKINDTVIPPHEINNQISENLSNAVMKAIAVEKHMRFKNIDDLLKALNGEKKVVTLAKERKRRKSKRFLGVLAACLALVITACSFWNIYTEKKAEQILNPATISVWFSVSEGSTEESAMNRVVEDFRESFPNVTIETKAIPENEYLEAINNAVDNGRLPTLFESTSIPSAVLEQSTDVTKILNSTQSYNCLFLEQYEDYYPVKKQIPLAIEVPMAYVITKGSTSVDYQSSYFSKITDFGKDVRIAVNSAHRELISANYDITGMVEHSEFLNNEANTCAVMLSSSMSMNLVRETLTNYEKTYVFPNSDTIKCRFTYEWSLGSGSKDEISAGERLLSWMLGNAYQNTLMISSCNEGQIPINETCFEEKISQKNLSPIKEIYKQFSFTTEENSQPDDIQSVGDTLSETDTSANTSLETSLIGRWEKDGGEYIVLNSDETFSWNNLTLFDTTVTTMDGTWSENGSMITFATNSGGLYYCLYELDETTLKLSSCEYDGTLGGGTSYTYSKK